jgi:D-alanine-D-alanine ligase
VHASPSRPIPGPVAVLHQALDPPLIDGARKPPKRGGYTDSGADIAYALRSAGVAVVTPGPAPDPSRDEGWTFPDTADGIGAAFAAGARVLWANTVLFAGHPLESVSGVRIVGQRPADVHRFDDKWHARNVLGAEGLPFPAAVLAGVSGDDEAVAGDMIDDAMLERAGIGPEAIVKPVRGRGSQGVSRASSALEIREALAGLFAATRSGPDGPTPIYGDRAIIEEFLPGEEITVAVLPPGTYRFEEGTRVETRHWALPVIRRTGHARGIAPYSGIVPIIRNSAVMTPAESGGDIARAVVECERAAECVGARAPVRIDCRRSRSGRMTLFDVNLKPNLTGPGRPGREAGESLVSLAGRAAGWSYPEMLLNLLGAAWPS